MLTPSVVVAGRPVPSIGLIESSNFNLLKRRMCIMHRSRSGFFRQIRGQSEVFARGVGSHVAKPQFGRKAAMLNIKRLQGHSSTGSLVHRIGKTLQPQRETWAMDAATTPVCLK